VPDHTPYVPPRNGNSGGQRADVQARGPAAARKPRPSAGGVKGGSRLRMRNWRLRTKVIAVIVVPTLTALVVSGLRAADDLDRAAEFQQTVSQVDLARNVTGVVDELQKERTLSVSNAPAGELDKQIIQSDAAVAAAQRAAKTLDTDDDAAKQRYNIGLQRLSALGAIRNTVNNTEYPTAAVFAAYSAVLDAVVSLGREINTAITDRNLLRDGTVIQALSEAKENVAKENAILEIAATNDSFPADLLNRIRDAQASAAGAVATYRANASSDQLQLYSSTVSGPAIDNRQRIKASAIASAERSTPDDQVSLGINVAALNNDGAITLERLRSVETELLGTLRDNANALGEAATESAWRDAAIVLVVLLVALGLTLVVSGSLLRPLRVLRREALDVANRKLPASLRRILADPDPAEAAKHAVAPVPVFTREEIGEVARSFDAVHNEAVKMATEQALLRENINSIFVNLSRRSQTLIERLLSLIDRLEQDELDPEQLSNLFEVDHLVTRMRRNSESLLVLSGTGLSRQLSRPVSAADVVGAAISEVEHYARIEVASAPDVAVQGRAVSDLVHVIAELLDNATFFSPADQKVIVRMTMTRRHELTIQITDHGVGMSEDQIEAANARLAVPPDLDVAVTRRMGLYVVARLAKRHNITVRLRDNEDIEGGLIARITVPVELVQQPTNATSRTLAPSTSTTTRAPSSTGSGAPISASLPPVSDSRARSTGIAGAFTGNTPQLRTDGGQMGGLGAETQRDRTPQEVAGYPAFTLGPGQNGSNTTTGLGAESGLPGSAALFGNALPDPGLAPPQAGPPSQGGHSSLGAGRDAARAEARLSPDAPTERLPIYDAVLSQWFKSADTGSQPPVTAQAEESAEARHAAPAANGTSAAPPVEAAPVKRAERAERSSWTSPGDDGWLAAQALVEDKTPDVTTQAGLPRRVPKAHLLPGSAAPRSVETTAERPALPQLPPRTADAVRGRMSSFQQGVRRGRHAFSDAYSGNQSGLEDSRQDEEHE
jgi:signal transduction histidine kinase